GVADDAMWIAALIRKTLQPFGLTDGIVRVESDVNMNRLHDVLVLAVREKMLEQIAVADRRIIAKEGRLHAVLEPRIAMIFEVVEMVMRINDLEILHFATCASNSVGSDLQAPRFSGRFAL